MAPRRLAVKVLNLATQQPSKEIEKRGPAVSVAFDAEGKPTKAAEGWARGCGITVEQAERIATDKGEWLVHRAKIEGQPTKNLLNDIVANALAKLPIPKPMRWADKTVQFIRPVHTVTMLLGDELIEGKILGVASARTIRGHRFLGEKELTTTTTTTKKYYRVSALGVPAIFSAKPMFSRTVMCGYRA